MSTQDANRKCSLLPRALVLLGVIWIRQSSAQASPPQQTSWTFADASGAVTKCMLQADPNSDEARVVASIAESVKALRAQYIAGGTRLDTTEAIRSQLGEAYTSTLNADLEVLNDLPTQPGPRLQALRAVADDLAIKERFRPSTSGHTATEVSTKVDLTVTFGPPRGNVDAQSIDSRAISCALTLKLGLDKPAQNRPLPVGQFLGRGTDTQKTTMPPGCFFWFAQASGKTLQAFPQPIGQGTETHALVRFF